MTIPFSDDQFRYWRQLAEQFEADKTSRLFYEDLDRQRFIAQSEMKELLSSFLREEINVKDFQAICDRKTQSDWKAFGLAGWSGGSFLDRLILYTANESRLAIQMRIALLDPKGLEVARKRMQGFRAYVDGWIKSQQVTMQQLQPNRVPFYLSSWWHMQAREMWPIFYDTARDALKVAKMYKPTGKYVEDYFAFRESFLSLAQKMSLDIWKLEHICAWKMGNQK